MDLKWPKVPLPDYYSVSRKKRHAKSELTNFLPKKSWNNRCQIGSYNEAHVWQLFFLQHSSISTHRHHNEFVIFAGYTFYFGTCCKLSVHLLSHHSCMKISNLYSAMGKRTHIVSTLYKYMQPQIKTYKTTLISSIWARIK